MKSETFQLRDSNPAVYLESYILNDSPEFQSGRLRPAVIVCPGGGYMMTSDREAEPVALRFAARGFHTFVLRYSVNAAFPAPMLDLARAMRIVRENAAGWLLDPGKVAVCGFSAGGHLAASLGVLWDDPLLTGPLGVAGEQIRPDALILGYAVADLEMVGDHALALGEGSAPVSVRDWILSIVMGEPHPAEELRARYRTHERVSAATPPAFLWHTADDDVVLALNSLGFATALARHGVPYELHIFESGVHGLSLADETTAGGAEQVNPAAQIWMELAIKWLERRFA